MDLICSAKLRKVSRALNRRLALPGWYFFKLKDCFDRHVWPSKTILGQVPEVLGDKETLLQAVLTRSAENGDKRFLEIGIGESLNITRVEFMKNLGIQYTGCDFESVCDNHKRELVRLRVLTDHIGFAPNKVGTYTWTLLEMLSEGKQFDVIYLDGHHTLYVDLPAALLAHFLLKPGGFFLLDDIQWTLTFLKSNMLRQYYDWRFYRRMYDFSEYESHQQNLPHIKMIVEQILIAKLGYLKVTEYSTPQWWALRKERQ